MTWRCPTVESQLFYLFGSKLRKYHTQIKLVGEYLHGQILKTGKQIVLLLIFTIHFYLPQGMICRTTEYSQLQLKTIEAVLENMKYHPVLKQSQKSFSKPIQNKDNKFVRKSTETLDLKISHP